MAVADKLDLPEELRVALRRGGLFRDRGQLAVPVSLPLKPGPLTADERKIMEQHTVPGERICAPVLSFRHVLPIICHPLEKQDGSGYGDGPKRNQVPITACILQITDIYDALTADRPCRRALLAEKAFRIIKDEVMSGGSDGTVLNEFEAVVYGSESVQATLSGRKGRICQSAKYA